MGQAEMNNNTKIIITIIMEIEMGSQEKSYRWNEVVKIKALTVEIEIMEPSLNSRFQQRVVPAHLQTTISAIYCQLIKLNNLQTIIIRCKTKVLTTRLKEDRTEGVS